MSNTIAFRQRLIARERLFGTFVKTPTTHATEILGALGYDFVVVDAEHSPFDRAAIDMLALAARAARIAALVRIAEPSPSDILSVLDVGCTGVLVPHVSSARKAREVAAACRYRGGSRGFASTTRAGGFGTAGMADHIREQDATVTCIAMIEDPSALDEIEEIAGVAGIDAFFIGRGDLAAAMGADTIGSDLIRPAVERIAAAARAAGKPVLVVPTGLEDSGAMAALGATGFVLSNDQSLLQRAARQALTDFTIALG